MALLTALMMGYGGYGQGREQHQHDQQENQRLASETAYQTAETKQAEQDAQIRATQAGYQFGPDGKLAPLPMRPGYDPMPKNANGEALYNWASKNYATALAQNDPQGIDRWGKAQMGYASGYQKTTSGDVNQARVPLLQAQTTWWKGRHQEVEDALKNRLAAVDAQVRGRAQAARISASRRLSSSGYSQDQREMIAAQAALNVASGRIQGDGFQEAMAQYHEAATQWNSYERNYLAGKATPAGFDPNTPPTPGQFTINVQSQQPQATLAPVVITLPDGSKKTVEQVKYLAPPPVKLPPLQAQIAHARASGVTDRNQMRAGFIKAGYPPAQVDAALFPGGGFGKP